MPIGASSTMDRRSPYSASLFAHNARWNAANCVVLA